MKPLYTLVYLGIVDSRSEDQLTLTIPVSPDDRVSYVYPKLRAAVQETDFIATNLYQACNKLLVDWDEFPFSETLPDGLPTEWSLSEYHGQHFAINPERQIKASCRNHVEAAWSAWCQANLEDTLTKDEKGILTRRRYAKFRIDLKMPPGYTLGLSGYQTSFFELENDSYGSKDYDDPLHAHEAAWEHYEANSSGYRAGEVSQTDGPPYPTWTAEIDYAYNSKREWHAIAEVHASSEGEVRERQRAIVNALNATIDNTGEIA